MCASCRCEEFEPVAPIPIASSRTGTRKMNRDGGGTMITQVDQNVADRWMDEQLFEEDVRAVMLMLRPHRRERMAGWSEYRTGGKHFRATISWDPQFQRTAPSDGL